MRIKEGYKIRRVAGENLVIMQGENEADMTKVISLNDTAEWLWKQVEGKDFTLLDLVSLLQSRFEVNSHRALADAEIWVKELSKCSVFA